MPSKKAKKTYELFLVFEADPAEAERLADEAWFAANGARSTSSGNVVLGYARERLADHTLADVDWPGWQTMSEIDLRASY